MLCFFFLALVAGKLAAQVNLQTGSATFSLPIFNWQDDKSRLNSTVALSYNSGNGLKVSDLPSNVGQGWNLFAGGTIVRLQAGEPDDQWPREGSEWDVTKYPPGILFATEPASKGCPTALTKYPIYGWKNQIYNQHNKVNEDKQLDYFAFQFNGKAGMFVLDPTNIGTCKSLGDSKIKISFQQDAGLVNQGIRTRITSFTIQDADGLIYKFARHGLTKLLKSEYCDASLTQYQRQPKFENGKVYHQAGFDNGQIVNPWVIGSWYLTEIEDALTHRKIFFNYVTRNITNDAGEEVIFNETKNYAIVFHKKSISQTPALTSVVYPDGHTATLNYGASRLDLTGDNVLSSLDISYNGRYLSRHELTTSYFILNRYGTPVSDYQKKVARLCLLSIRKIGPDLAEDTPPYKFDYYTGSNNADDVVPPPFSFAKDIWGFYNGDKTKGFWYEPINPTQAGLSGITNSNHIKGLCYLRHDVSGMYYNPKTGYARNGLLRQIIYPTGGTLSYNYAQNYGVINGVYREVGGVHVSETSSTDGGFSNGCNNPITTNYSYINPGASGSSSLWGLEAPVNSKLSVNHYQPEYKYYRWAGCFPFGCCDWKFKYPGIESMQQFTDLTGFQKAMAIVSPVLNIVSLISTIQDIITAFSGGNPVALIIDVILGVVQIALTCIGNQERDSYTTLYYSSNLNDAASLPTQFKRVEVTESPGGTGKTIQEFTSDDDYAIWEPTNPAFSSKQRFAPWAYGLPKRTIVFNSAGDSIKVTENFYDFSKAKSIINYCDPHSGPCNPPGLFTNLVSCKCTVEKSTSQRNTDWADPAHYNNPASYQTTSSPEMKVDFYGMYSGRTELIRSKERIFKQGDPTKSIESITEYNYNPNNYEVSSIRTTDFNGERKDKDIKYSCDYSSYGILSQLVQNNIVAAPVSTSTSVFKNVAPNSWAYFFLDEKVTEYTQSSTGDIKPYRILEQRFETPIPAYYNPTGPVFQAYIGPGDPYNPAYKEVQTFTYDGQGRLIGMKDEGDRRISNLYGYNDKYVTTTVINADAVTDKPACTSFEVAGEFGGWVQTGLGSYNNTQSMTGGIAYNFISLTRFSTTTFTTTLNPAKPYLISFWSTTSGITVSGGAVLVKSSPTINGFTYYEYEVPQGNSSVVVQGTGVVDELRCYPKAARMRSVTYDPIIGKTSECDENNRITYFEYDLLGRLRFIRDEKKNIVKMYEYNNVSAEKQNGCPGIYYNRQITESFTKNNCGPGYIGSTVTFTVPANIYSSTLSQQDADAQAESYILLNGQQYANTNGTCTVIFYNTVQSQNFVTESCGPGYIGGTVTYTVPAGRYSSLISQADANQMALDEIAANGEAYANTPPNAVCLPDATPLWIWLEGAPWYCAIVPGFSEPHLFVLETDINPSSASYQNTRWSDTGPSDLCPTGLYYNTLQSGTFTKNDCPPGYVGSQVTYSVQQGSYSSSVSQAAADQLAINDVNANGQSYANTHGTCSQGCPPYCENSPAFKCINNICEQGIRVNTNTYADPGNYPFWICEFHYEFSDGSWSQTLYESNPDPCY